uniref:Lipocalin n=1 Tax=Steinernema glaseri TaxID=37863 RepID=A0A1I8A7S9_9BILA
MTEPAHSRTTNVVRSLIAMMSLSKVIAIYITVVFVQLCITKSAANTYRADVKVEFTPGSFFERPWVRICFRDTKDGYCHNTDEKQLKPGNYTYGPKTYHLGYRIVHNMYSTITLFVKTQARNRYDVVTSEEEQLFWEEPMNLQNMDGEFTIKREGWWGTFNIYYKCSLR